MDGEQVTMMFLAQTKLTGWRRESVSGVVYSFATSGNERKQGTQPAAIAPSLCLDTNHRWPGHPE
jgi:hypothetical protein